MVWTAGALTIAAAPVTASRSLLARSRRTAKLQLVNDSGGANRFRGGARCPKPGLAAEDFAAFAGSSLISAGDDRVFLAMRRRFLPWLSINNRGVRELLTLPQSVHEFVSSWLFWASFQPHA
ncbi:hypothetical protein K3723_13545 [Leisingera caerulea]|uniref:hypothetical protein n=1 Tax=Leisingera caerulea TaxID=506591 RepID=UPI0021A3AA05|nr:hypothetical protein [Leisingera caerulea]UWQ61875.1 hypothetical protein K3723_13545 [Leisingera caerulea]